jgi:hypothetical protein
MTELAPSEHGKRDLSIVPPGADIFDARKSSPRSRGSIDGPWDSNRNDLPSAGLQPEFVEPEGEPDAPPVAGACRWCRAELPRRDSLRFCPHCGTDVHLVPCVTCGEELEADWRFCVACGTEVA